MRGIHKILKVARTIADLEGAPAIEQRHLGEAVALRR
jgi:magnesium chelatase family protein